MNEHLPYEDELLERLGDIPLPNEDMAWKDMKRRLEKGNDKGPVLPPILSGCAGYGLLFLLLLIACLVIVDPAEWFHDKMKSDPVKSAVRENSGKEKRDKGDSGMHLPGSNSHESIVSIEDTSLTRGNVPPANKDGSISIKDTLQRVSAFQNSDKVKREYHRPARQNIKKNRAFEQRNGNVIFRSNNRHKGLTKKTHGKMRSRSTGHAEAETVTSDRQNPIKGNEEPADEVKDIVAGIIPKTGPGSDSINEKQADTVVTKENTGVVKKQIYFGTGLGLHQLLPVAGQKTNPYNSTGRKGFLGDYIPSLYLRMYKDKRWFIQSEFRYGAPQYTKEILFGQKISETTGAKISTNSIVKKTYYHQLPVSFNYFLLPGFSIGTGFTFNKFNSAVVQQEVHLIFIGSQIDSLVSTAVVNQKRADSNFVTTYMQALVETQFQWKRFSAGARYSFGVQPYLKFKLPGGEQRSEKNSSLQLFIRYELWRSVKK